MESPQGNSRSIRPSNEDELIKEILGSNILDSENCTLYVKPLLNIIKVIFSGAVDPSGFIKGSPTFNISVIQVLEWKHYKKLPTAEIKAIFYEICGKFRDEVDRAHTITMGILEITKHYNWDAKVVLALIVFAVAFGEFRLVSQLYMTNPVAKAVALLKQLPKILVGYAGALKPELDELFPLIEEILDVTKKIVYFYDFPLHNYFSTEAPEIAAANSYIPVAVYWTIQSIVVSLTQILALTGSGIKHLNISAQMLLSAQKLRDIKGHLVERIECRNRFIENQKKDGYQDIARILGSSNADNSKCLKIFLDKSGLYDCNNKTKISYEHLNGEVVVLFITDLDSDITSRTEYAIVTTMYRWISKFKVVWVPIVDNNNWTAEEFKKFESGRQQMKWHSLDNPSNMDQMVIRFIKEEWNFVGNPLAVVMDTQGKLVHKNGIYMMHIWGILPYPFTTITEKQLWNGRRWSIDLLAGTVEDDIELWIKEGKHICLYGGEDVNWIKRLANTTKYIASEGVIIFELLYVGRSKIKEKVEDVIDIIEKENLSRTLYWKLIRVFWVRLQSMFYSKQLIEGNENDPIIQDFRALLSYDSEKKNWALISNSEGEMIIANGEDVLKGLHQLSNWNVDNKISFVQALDEYIPRTYSGFRPSNDDELIKKICGGNSLNSENCILNVKPLLDIIKVIFNGATHDPLGCTKGSPTHDIAAIQVLKSMSKEIPRAISYEIFDKCKDGVDVHTITMEVLEITKNCNWDAKVVLSLVPFAITFGEFLHMVQLYATNPIAKAVALLKQFPEPKMEHELVDLLFALIREIFDVTEKIVNFYHFPLHNYFTAQSPEIIAVNVYTPVAVYWTIRSLVVSLTQVFALTGTGIVFLITEQSESAQKLKDIKGRLVELIESCNRSIEKKKYGFQDMARILGSSNADNSKSLKIFLDKPGLYDCYNRRKISYEHLKSKVVALFITDLDSDITRTAECAILQQLYLEKWHNRTRTESKYEVVWIPILVNNNWTIEEFKLFEKLRPQMEWYSVDNPSKVDPLVISFIKEEWNFVEKPIVVVMDAEGKIVNKNGIYMMCIWGSLAYPFTTVREEVLWKETKWSIDLLIDNIELNMDIWIRDGKHICLYGGEDLNWIKRFTKFAKGIASEAGISLELLYVGRSKLKNKMVKIIDLIEKENISRTLDWKLMWYFWVRLESMLYSKQLMKSNENDRIMQGIHALLRYDSEQENWAIISSRRAEMVLANGNDVLKGMRQLSKRNPRENKIDFVHALDECIPKTCAVPAALNDDTSHLLTATVSKKDFETFKVIERILESMDIHDLKSRGALFPNNYGDRAFYDFYNKKRISSNNLRRRIVVLFITDLDPEILYGLEYTVLQKMYKEKQHNPTWLESQYDLVWVPVTKLLVWQKYKTFESLRDQMEWPSVNPLMVPPEDIKYIQQNWDISNEPKLVVMDTQCRVVHHDSIHMMSIWRHQAYPFSTEQEKCLWKNVSWWIDLLLEKLEPNKDISEYICLYGGEDIEWIQSFTKKAKSLAKQAGITLELLYVGMINSKKQVIKNIVMTIQKEKLSRTLDWNLISDFWMRLESIQYSKRHATKSKNVMQGIDLMQSHSSIHSGWALIGRGPGEVVNGIDGAVMIKCLDEYERWQPRVDKIGFVSALDERYRLFQHMIPVSAPTPRILPDDI